ncbi:MAG TPA: hypothetical protein VN224_05585 [Xanthomonadales bacterium]|nr:hypothetical protein [Xanthomonadales bacterium]
MTQLAAIWEFIAGDSRRAPVAVALAVLVAAVLLRASVASGIVAATFACIIALGLAAAVFERQ